MFDRRLYKKQAREQLKGRWKLPVLLTLLELVIISCLAEPAFHAAETDISVKSGSLHFSASAPLVFTLLFFAVNGILTTAGLTVYLRLSRTERPAGFSNFLDGLERWLGAALGGLWFALWTHLWALLFVIPGIIKALSYSQMFYILAENPAVGVRKAMRMSKVITQGYKGDLFVMGLSFFGWGFLCVLSCGIGFLWLFPYINMSAANTYAALKNMAIMTNKITPADFAPAEDTQGDVQ